MVLQSVVPDLKIPKTTLSQYVLEALKMFGNDIALVSVHGIFQYALVKWQPGGCATEIWLYEKRLNPQKILRVHMKKSVK